MVDVYVLEDQGQQNKIDLQDSEQKQKKAMPVQDIWQVLGTDAASWGSRPELLGQSLEIVIGDDGSYFDAPIDTVFIPMAHMEWSSDKFD